MNSNTAKGFEPRLPNKTEIAAIANRFKSIIREWRTPKLKVVFAYLNALTYRACRCAGILKRVRRAQGKRKGFHRIVGDIKAIALKGISGFNITIEGIADQLFNFWQLKISETSLRKYRYELRDVFDLFDFQSEPFPAGRIGDPNNRRPPQLQNFDLPLALILLEALEDILVRERGCELTEFPGCGAMGRMIYNAVFRGNSRDMEGKRSNDYEGSSYRRKNESADVVVMRQGDSVVWASEMDWSSVELNERGRAAWYGGVVLIPNEDGIIPELLQG